MLFVSEIFHHAERRVKIRYTAEETLNMILEATEDSDIGALSESDSEAPECEDSSAVEMNCSEIEKHTESKEDDTLMRYSNRSFRMPGLRRSTRSTPCAENIDQTCSFIDNVVLGAQNVVDAPVSGQIPSDSESSAYNSDSSDSDTDDIQIEDALRKHNFRWRSIKPPVSSAQFQGESFSLPPDDFEDMSPYDFFSKFWSDDITELIVGQTNLYSVLKNGRSVNTNSLEIEQFFGIQMMMGIISMPAYINYWVAETRVNIIADTMSKRRYKALRGSIHLVDNTLQDPSKPDKLFKIRPLLDMVRINCLKVEPEEVMSVDEQIIPSKTKRSGIRQYNLKKPIKWDFKMLFRAGANTTPRSQSSGALRCLSVQEPIQPQEANQVGL